MIGIKETFSERTVNELRSLFARYGIPKVVVSDNGTQFVSSEMTRFLTQNGIRHITSAPYHPATNGLAERFVQTFKKAVGKSAVGVRRRLDQFLLA